MKKYIWIFIAVFAFFITLWGFQTVPGFWFDEGIIAQTAKNISEYGIYGIQTAPGEFFTDNFWITTGYPVIFPVALVFKLFGVSIFTARIISLIYLVLFVVSAYFFVKKLFGYTSALFSTLLLSTFAPLYGNGKAVLGETPGLFWIVLGGLFFLLYEERNEKKFLFFSALSWGIAVATKPYYLLFSVSVLFAALFLWLKIKVKITHIFSFLAAFSIPVFYWVFLSFDVSSMVKFNVTFSYLLNSYGVASFEPLKNLFRFVSESTPIHFAVLSIIVFSARLVALKKKIPTPVVIDALLIFIGLSFLWYLKTPGWYRYFYSIHVLILLLFPPAFFSLLEYFTLVTADRIDMKKLGTRVMISLVVFQVVFLFVKHDQFFGSDVLAMEKYTTTHIPAYASVYVASKPEVSFVLRQKNFSQYIFINQNLVIGNEIIKYGYHDYIIMSISEDRFFTANKEVINNEYITEKEIGHYRLYRKKDIPPVLVE